MRKGRYISAWGPRIEDKSGGGPFGFGLRLFMLPRCSPFKDYVQTGRAPNPGEKKSTTHIIWISMGIWMELDGLDGLELSGLPSELGFEGICVDLYIYNHIFIWIWNDMNRFDGTFDVTSEANGMIWVQVLWPLWKNMEEPVPGLGLACGQCQLLRVLLAQSIRFLLCSAQILRLMTKSWHPVGSDTHFRNPS